MGANQSTARVEKIQAQEVVQMPALQGTQVIDCSVGTTAEIMSSDKPKTAQTQQRVLATSNGVRNMGRMAIQVIKKQTENNNILLQTVPQNITMPLKQYPKKQALLPAVKPPRKHIIKKAKQAKQNALGTSGKQIVDDIQEVAYADLPKFQKKQNNEFFTFGQTSKTTPLRSENIVPLGQFSKTKKCRVSRML